MLALPGNIQRAEHGVLRIFAVNPNTSPSDFVTIADQIIGFGFVPLNLDSSCFKKLQDPDLG